eukprot:CAMPEP_0184859098 /NCGR_PEP_ID=MMETSP0580-20130426/4139_1 /TAXON_ID=1118495 /ORGANISM="Dactyliosolen fragilissimus" /LENGTH=1153 /DNA_ID=CAMNT_0027355565 /DNA_START=731 /DNA_END=4192 /DNA_ORIENTATION=+
MTYSRTPSHHFHSIISQTRRAPDDVSLNKAIYRLEEERSALQVSVFIDTTIECYPQLEESYGSDSLLDGDEYITFLNLSYDNYFKNINTFMELPPTIKDVFNTLACDYCYGLFQRENPKRDCFCNDEFSPNRVNATTVHYNPAHTFSKIEMNQIVYLYEFCEETIHAMTSIMTYAPSSSPSMLPTTEPTPIPTTSIPSTTPTSDPTFFPSKIPSDSPSSTPSFKPSGSPTLSPSSTPSFLPSVSFKPSVPPASNPPQSTSLRPTNPNLSFTDIEVPFMIANSVGITAEDLSANIDGKADMLSNAFRSLVLDVIDNFNENIGTNNRKILRNLEMRRKLETISYAGSYLDSFDALDCPPDLVGSLTCASVRGNVRVSSNIAVEISTLSSLKTSLSTAIDAGELQDSDGIFFSSLLTQPKNINSSNEEVLLQSNNAGGLGTGAIAGIAAGAAAIGLAAGVALFINQRRGHKSKTSSHIDNDNFVPFYDVPRHQVKTNQVANFRSLDSVDEDDRDGSIDLALESVETSDRDRSNSFGGESNSIESSSNAGSSGWSSSAGMSSMNTGSVDSMDFGYGSSLAAMGAVSNFGGKYGKAGLENFIPVQSSSDPDNCGSSFDNDDANIPKVSRADLDLAIEAGDWAAVGQTAALLALSDSRSESSSYTSSHKSGFSSSDKSTDIVQSTDLDHLVDQGDWEGVVLAAAKFEAQSENDEDTNDSETEDPSASSHSGPLSSSAEHGTSGSYTDQSGATSSAYTPSVSTNISESASNAQKYAEIRAEVEALVRRVVPDEIDNIDEMMRQFKGREEELVETLRTMQERSIAQRARAAKMREVKRDVRKSARKSNSMMIASGTGLPPIGSKSSNISNKKFIGKIDDRQEKTSTRMLPPRSPSHSQGSVSIDSANSSSSRRKNTKLNNSPDSPRRSALERAIEAGDWDAVGEAAAMMGDASVSSVGTSELGSLDESTTSSQRSSAQKIEKNVKKTSEDVGDVNLDRLIDQGDWTGVVAAATQFGAMKEKKSSHKKHSILSNSNEDGSSVSEKGSWRKRIFGGKRSIASGSSKDISNQNSGESLPLEKKEQDALAQAEIWMSIAAQSKNDESVDANKGASVAADWAISRSFSALRNADENKSSSGRKKLFSSGSSSSIRSVGSSTGDKSV